MTSYFGNVPVTPSENHFVLFEEFGIRSSEISVFEEGKYVVLPNYDSARHPSNKKKIWDIVREVFSGEFPSSFEELRSAILSFNHYEGENSSFLALRMFLEDSLTKEENEHFFKVLLPKIIRLALTLPTHFPKPLPLLKRGVSLSISLTQKQISVLLANGFLCTFPQPMMQGRSCGKGNYPDFNFNRLFVQTYTHTEHKFKCLMNYFERITSEEPEGVVTFTRQCIRNPAKSFDFKTSSAPLPDLKVDLENPIEEAKGHLQVDFADKYIGGMIFTKGCVQEEIRFLLCPELIVTRLFTEILDDEEALIVTGIEQYNQTTGYSRSFQYVGSFVDDTPRDEFQRRKCQMVAIDATSFRRRIKEQYKPPHVMRELHKAYIGFLPIDRRMSNLDPVATGNWGCGVFGGDPRFKSLLQAMAAGAAGRNLTYFAFGNGKLASELESIYSFLKDKKVTIGELLSVMLLYHQNMPTSKQNTLYKFIRNKI